MPIAAKIYNKLILNRTITSIDPLVKMTLERVEVPFLAIRRTLEEMRKLNKDLYWFQNPLLFY